MMGSHEDECIDLWKIYMQRQRRKKGRPAGQQHSRATWIHSEEGKETDEEVRSEAGNQERGGLGAWNGEHFYNVRNSLQLPNL